MADRRADTVIGLSEAAALPGMVVERELGMLSVAVPVAAFRGMIGTGRAAEAALRRAAAESGASHVLAVRIVLRQRLWGIGAMAQGRAVVLRPDDAAVAAGPDL